MSQFTYACPVCHQHLKCDTTQAGSIMKCPTCYQRVIAPQAPSQADSKLILTGQKYVEKNLPVPAPVTSNTPAKSGGSKTMLTAVIGGVAVLAVAGLIYFFMVPKSPVLWQMGYTPDTALTPSPWQPDRPTWGIFASDANFIVGKSHPGKDWPERQAGPADSWAGNRNHTYTLTFTLKKVPQDGGGKLVIDLAKTQGVVPPKLAIQINDFKVERATQPEVASTISVTFPPKTLRPGSNKITITTISGSWLVYRGLKCVSGNDGQP